MQNILQLRSYSCIWSSNGFKYKYNSYNIIAKKIEKTNFLIWAGIRLAVPPHLKLNLGGNDHTFLMMPPSLIIRNNDFNTLKKKSKHFYALLISRRAQLSKNALDLKNDFNLTEDQVFLLPHMICFESYVTRPFNIRSLTLYFILMLNCLK